MKQFFVERIGKKGFLVSDGEGPTAKKLGAFTGAGDLVFWIDQELNANLLDDMRYDDGYPDHLDLRHHDPDMPGHKDSGVDITGLASSDPENNDPAPLIPRHHFPINEIDDAGEPESIGKIAERVVRKAGGDKKPIVPDVRDDERPVAVAVSCKPDGSDLKQNLMRETIKKPLTEAQKKVLYFLQAAIAKHGNHGIQFDYAKVAEKTMHTENYVKGCIKTLGLRGDLVLDVRAKGHAPFISLPVPEKKK